MPLILNEISKSFGGLVALEKVTLRMLEGQVTAIAGANGAGKSTLFNIIGGYLKPDNGEVMLADRNSIRPVINLSGMPPHLVAANGVGILFQSVRVFGRLSALENVLTGFPHQPGERVLHALIRTSSVVRAEKANLEEAMHLLELVGLRGNEHQQAGNLSFGEQKFVAIARLLAAKASVLLLDEPTAGVHPNMIEQLLTLIQFLAHKESRVVAFIEHNSKIVSQVADTMFWLENGHLVHHVKAQTNHIASCERIVAF